MSEPVMAAIIGSLITTEKQKKNWLVTQLTHVRHKLPLFMTSQPLPNKHKMAALAVMCFCCFQTCLFVFNEPDHKSTAKLL